jgi:putative transposase
LDAHYGVNYQSKQSYYTLLHQAGMSYKKRQASNPKKDQQQVLQKREAIKKSTPASLQDPATGTGGSAGR